jgi:phosphoenolpyruvate carboxykinase (GTP)
MRVLKWMIDRLEGTTGAGVEHLTGVSPNYGDLNWNGLDFTPAQFDTVTRTDAAAWRDELALHDKLFEQLAQGLPQELKDTRAELEDRLATA